MSFAIVTEAGYRRPLGATGDYEIRMGGGVGWVMADGASSDYDSLPRIERHKTSGFGVNPNAELRFFVSSRVALRLGLTLVLPPLIAFESGCGDLETYLVDTVCSEPLGPRLILKFGVEL